MIAGARAARRAALLVALAPGVAAAGPWRAQTEAGVEYDSNVTRIPRSLGPEDAPVLRTSARVDRTSGAARKLRWSLLLGGEAKAVLEGPVDTEDVLTATADLGAVRRTSDHVTVGARVAHYEAWPLAAPEQSRAFAASSADATIAIDDDHGRRASVTASARRLVYKRDRDFDWTGPAVTLALEDPLWRGGDDRAIDLVVAYRLERRSYRGLAYRNGCTPVEPFGAHCYVPDTEARRDLVHVAAARATYTGARVATLAYELTVDDSTSFGSSLVRQRVTASITTPLPARVFATATVTGQLDHYPDPLLVARDVDAQMFTSLDDESRSAAAVRLARSLGGAWQVEARWSIQANAFVADAPQYRRQVVYAGARWER